jgi:lipopolysaccharide biosynthesis glycosyltransferase
MPNGALDSHDRRAVSIHLFSTINTAFVVPFRVTAHSLRRSRPATTPVTWHVFEPDLSAEDKAAIEAGLDGSAIDIVWYRYAKDPLARLPLWGRAVPGMYERVLAPDALPDTLERAIYLDADLLVLDAVDVLWQVDLGGLIIGAVQDAVIPRVSSPLGLRRYRELGCRAEDPYFNAGVLVIDLEAWKRQHIGQRALEYLERYERSVNLTDQDALNAVLHNRWKPLEDRWNVVAGLAGRPRLEPRGIEPSRMAAAARDPAIVHFYGYLKPWVYDRLGSRWANAYRQALLEVYPDYRFGRSMKSLCLSLYDRRLRTVMHPLEQLAWRATRHVP